jgi:hypothetical protein
MALQPLLVLYFFTFGSLLNFLVLAWKLIIAVQNFTHMVVQNEFYKNHDHKTYVVTGNYTVVPEHKVSKMTLYSSPLNISQVAKISEIIQLI